MLRALWCNLPSDSQRCFVGIVPLSISHWMFFKFGTKLYFIHERLFLFYFRNYFSRFRTFHLKHNLYQISVRIFLSSASQKCLVSTVAVYFSMDLLQTRHKVLYLCTINLFRLVVLSDWNIGQINEVPLSNTLVIV